MDDLYFSISSLKIAKPGRTSTPLNTQIAPQKQLTQQSKQSHTQLSLLKRLKSFPDQHAHYLIVQKQALAGLQNSYHSCHHHGLKSSGGWLNSGHEKTKPETTRPSGTHSHPHGHPQVPPFNPSRTCEIHAHPQQRAQSAPAGTHQSRRSR